MKLQESGENYLEAILMLHNRNGQVRAVDIAAELGFSKPSVSVAIKILRENGYVTVDSAGLIEMTERGLGVAERILERHNFLTEVLIAIGVSQETAHIDACKIEHDISEETFECLKKYLSR